MEYITDIILPDSEFPFAIHYGSGFSAEDEQKQRSYMHNHHCLEINFCLSGEGEYIITDDRYPICKDDIFIINNSEYHRAVNLSGDMRLMVIVFDPELILSESGDYQYIRAFFEWKNGFKHRLPGELYATDEMKRILCAIQSEWRERPVGWKLVMKSLLLMLLAIIYRRFESTEGCSKQIQQFQNSYARLSPAIRYIEKHFKEPVPLSVLAREAHISESYFSFLFSQTMNCTVSEYIMRMRLKNACILLNTTSQSIISVAMESGFRNVSYFNRAFCKAFGISPREYRKIQTH